MAESHDPDAPIMIERIMAATDARVVPLIVKGLCAEFCLEYRDDWPALASEIRAAGRNELAAILDAAELRRRELEQSL